MFTVMICISEKIKVVDHDSETVSFKLVANLDEIAILFTSNTQDLSLWQVKNVAADVQMHDAYTNVQAKLGNLIVQDLNPRTKYPKVKFPSLC